MSVRSMYKFCGNGFCEYRLFRNVIILYCVDCCGDEFCIFKIFIECIEISFFLNFVLLDELIVCLLFSY